MIQITPVLLCGGSGTRLWPLSRKACPKQFTRLTGNQTLFQATLERLSGPGWAAPMIVTAAAYLGLVHNQTVATGLRTGRILVEPSARNTAPAILAAALELALTDADALILIAPSDHAIPDAEAFRTTVAAGADAALNGQIVTFGIQPTRAETGYGWLELPEAPQGSAVHPLALRRFIEKPAHPQAEAMLAAGRYLWNAGIFLATAQTLIDAFATHAPGLFAPVRAAMAQAWTDGRTCHLAAEPWALSENTSVDYAVMEKVANLCVVPFAAGWSDLGDWNAIWREGTGDEAGVVTSGSVTAIDCQDSLLRCEIEGVELVGVGLTDIVVIAMGDAFLVADRSRVQEVKEAVARLEARHAVQAEGFASLPVPGARSFAVAAE